MNRSKKYLIHDDRDVARCWWCGQLPIYVDYHDYQWGRPVDDDRRLFEKICLEGFQSGLSWITILKKRENFRQAFKNFEIKKVARFSDQQIEKLVNNDKIIRHRGKIKATVQNAKCALEMIDRHGSVAAFVWQFEPVKKPKFDPRRATTAESESMSKTLKKLGWAFVGPTTCYSFMQSMGLVNDHHPDCHLWQTVEIARSQFRRPGV